MNPKWFIGSVMLLEAGAALSFAIKRNTVEALFWGALTIANLAAMLR